MYSQLYNTSYAFWGGGSALNYTSPVLHTAVMRDLEPATRSGAPVTITGVSALAVPYLALASCSPPRQGARAATGMSSCLGPTEIKMSMRILTRRAWRRGVSCHVAWGRYYYQVGDGETFSQTLAFDSLKAPEQDYPQRLVAVADW